MNNTININALAGLYENLSKSSTIQHSEVHNSDFLKMAAALRAGTSGAERVAPEESDGSMEAYRQTIWEKISKMPLSATRKMESISIHISDGAFERMKNDPDYEAWVLHDLSVAFSQTNPWVPVCGGYSVFYVGETKEECRGEGWYPGFQNGNGEKLFREKTSGSFWERRMEGHKKFMELQQEAAMERWLQQYRLSGGTASAVALLLELL